MFAFLNKSNTWRYFWAVRAILVRISRLTKVEYICVCVCLEVRFHGKWLRTAGIGIVAEPYKGQYSEVTYFCHT